MDPRGASEPGHRAGAPALADGARRTMLGALTLVRLTASLTILAVGLAAADDPHVLLYVGLCLVGLAEVAGTSVLLWRAGRTASGLATASLALDGVLVLVACAVSGGGDSPVLLLFMVLPVVAALVLDPWPIVAAGFGIAAGRLLLGGPGDEVAAFLVEGVWATTLGVVAARGRAVFWRRLDGVDAIWGALVPTSPREAVRVRVADELRIVALEPLTLVREELAATAAAAADPLPRERYAALAERVRAIGDATRSVVYELHAMSGLTGPAEARLRQLALRRAPGREVDVAVDPQVPEALAEPLGAVVRDALSLVVGAGTERVVVRARSAGRGVRLEVSATPAPRQDPRALQLRWAALTARAGVGEATLSSERDGGRRVSLRLRGLAAPEREERTVLGREFRETGPFIATMNIGFAVAGWLVTLLVGGAETAWYPAWSVATVMLLFFAWLLYVPRPVWMYLAMLAADAILLSVAFRFEGTDAQLAILPAALLVTFSAAGVWRPAVAAASCVGTGILLPLLGETPQPALSIVVAWVTVAAVAEAWVRRELAATLFAATRERLPLLTGLLAGEDEERRRLAGRLHDDVLQLLLVARQDLEEAGWGDAGAVAPALEAVDLARASLEQTAGELDAGEGAATVTGGLRDALARVADRRDGPPVAVEVAPGASGLHDGLLVQLARELYVNAAKHAQAAGVRVAVRREEGELVLEVVDDGVGFDPGRERAAVEEGHIGLATVRERVAAAGGRTQVRTGPGAGTQVLVRLPAIGAAAGLSRAA